MTFLAENLDEITVARSRGNLTLQLFGSVVSSAKLCIARHLLRGVRTSANRLPIQKPANDVRLEPHVLASIDVSDRSECGKLRKWACSYTQLLPTFSSAATSATVRSSMS